MTDFRDEFATTFDPGRFFALARQVGHGRALGLDYRGHGEDWVELALPWRPELVSMTDTGTMATGAIVSLVDTCSGTSVWTRMGGFRPIVTLDLRLDYLRPAAKGEEVIARCECYKLTRQVAFVRGVAHGGDPERPIAHSVATFMTVS
ncbi:PaaI family thioesterase [Sphingomonas sp. LHG3406-1]|uniref:PaaI family thioesterase n=1 Tax=Sphingomonas sp. LHG3406-1 TaxID=2804617 RepID=UPI00260DF9B2|nr:PaaI family thioesterase [Sphingomonas sp. LHG3406-1]